MDDIRVGGERLVLIQDAFRGMKAQRRRDGWVSETGRLDPVPGEALVRALLRTEAELPRRLGTTREEHRAAALDEIARQVQAMSAGGVGGSARRVPAARPSSAPSAEVDVERNERRRHLVLVSCDDGARR